MIFKTICEECGKEFIGDDCIAECTRHELIQHHNVEEIFKARLEEVLLEMDKKYGTKTTYKFKGIDCKDCEGNSYSDIVEYEFSMSNKYFSISLDVDTFYEEDNRQAPSIEIIKNKVDKSFKEYIKQAYEGIVEYAKCWNGVKIDDYMIDGCYLKYIFKELVGKKVKIEVIND